MMSPCLKNRSSIVSVASLLFLLAAALLFSEAGWAQTGAGTVAGTVRDAKQAVIPGAEVKVTNELTNVERTGVSNEVGIFTIAALPLGPYRMTVELAGFKKWAGTFTVMAGQQWN